MGHLHGRDIYREVVKKLDGQHVRVPFTKGVYEIVKYLYSPKEAELVVKMPFTPSNKERLLRITGYSEPELEKLLGEVCKKGFVIDLWIEKKNEYLYLPSPMLVGLFEYTMMRKSSRSEIKESVRLFHNYLSEGSYYHANAGNNNTVALARTMPHEEALSESAYVQIMDYENAVEVINRSSKIAMTVCQCRHEKYHAGVKECNYPDDNCIILGIAADYVIRQNFATEVSKSKALDKLKEARDQGLLLNCDNVRNRPQYLCQCCGCCCNLLAGITKFGYPNFIMTSNYIAQVDDKACSGCGKCAKACPIKSITTIKTKNTNNNKGEIAVVDGSLCLGCGVCALKCPQKSIRLNQRNKRLIYPETTFERVILQCLDRGNLENQIFDNPHSLTQDIMRHIIGGFLRLPPVKQALMSRLLRSTFLGSIKAGLYLREQGSITTI